jgi:hypothetical protein
MQPGRNSSLSASGAFDLQWLPNLLLQGTRLVYHHFQILLKDWFPFQYQLQNSSQNTSHIWLNLIVEHHIISGQLNTSQNSSRKNVHGIAILFMYPPRCYRQIVTTNLTPHYITHNLPYDFCNNTLKKQMHNRLIFTTEIALLWFRKALPIQVIHCC